MLPCATSISLFRRGNAFKRFALILDSMKWICSTDHFCFKSVFVQVQKSQVYAWASRWWRLNLFIFCLLTLSLLLVTFKIIWTSVGSCLKIMRIRVLWLFTWRHYVAGLTFWRVKWKCSLSSTMILFMWNWRSLTLWYAWRTIRILLKFWLNLKSECCSFIDIKLDWFWINKSQIKLIIVKWFIHCSEEGYCQCEPYT